MTEDELQQIFFPTYSQRMGSSKNEQEFAKFTHYTTAKNLINILETKKVWMRNTTCMQDYSEVEYGHQILRKFFSDETRRELFKSVLNACHSNIFEQAIHTYDVLYDSIKQETYVTCISEHDCNDDFGKLAMWERFAKDSVGAALVLNVSLKLDAPNSGLLISPIFYPKLDEQMNELDLVITKIQSNSELIKATNPINVISAIFAMLMTAAVSTKHPGFADEKEWRVIHNPKILPSKMIEQKINSIGGVPQIVSMIPLENSEEFGTTNLEPNQLIDRVIIGPTQYYEAVKRAMIMALENAGVADAENKVSRSDIPLR